MREKQFNLRLNELEWAHLEKRAKETGNTVSGYARWVLFREVEPYLPHDLPKEEVSKEIEKVEEKEAAPVKVEKKEKQKVCPRCVRLNSGKPLSGCRACLSGGS